jgi:hypothetical protein
MPKTPAPALRPPFLVLDVAVAAQAADIARELARLTVAVGYELIATHDLRLSGLLLNTDRIMHLPPQQTAPVVLPNHLTRVPIQRDRRQT